VNPTHLVFGTTADNAQDMMTKGRQGKSEPRLTYEQVQEIRRLLAHGATKSEITQRYGICRSTVQSIEAGTSWNEPAGQGWLFTDAELA